MDLVLIFSFIATIVLIITGGIVLLPIARRIGGMLGESTADRRALREGHAAAETAQLEEAVAQLARSLEAIDTRLERLDERQAFTERLLETRADPSLPTSGRGEA